LVLSYVPLTALDHLHLHIDHGLHLFHEHLHIGHHEHETEDRHRRDHREPHDPGQSDDECPSSSAVISLGQAAQVRPVAVFLDVAGAQAAVPSPELAVVPFEEPTHHSRNPRAPPVSPGAT
jgi:hypothetical protein